MIDIRWYIWWIILGRVWDGMGWLVKSGLTIINIHIWIVELAVSSFEEVQMRFIDTPQRWRFEMSRACRCHS